MTGDFFDRLEADLAGLTSQGSHLDSGPARARRRLATLGRRGVVVAALAMAFLAASLAGEATTSAGGNIPLAQVPAVRGH